VYTREGTEASEKRGFPRKMSISRNWPEKRISRNELEFHAKKENQREEKENRNSLRQCDLFSRNGTSQQYDSGCLANVIIGLVDVAGILLCFIPAPGAALEPWIGEWF